MVLGAHKALPTCDHLLAVSKQRVTDRLFLSDLALHQQYKDFGGLYLLTSQYFLLKPNKGTRTFPVEGRHVDTKNTQ
jgi:hypothetical protein